MDIAARRKRFELMVDRNGPTMPHMDTPCWVWTGATRRGYGTFWFPEMGAPSQYAHRAAWFFDHGSIPKTGLILHDCDHKPCVRHLYCGDKGKNVEDVVSRGLLRGERNGRAKLSDNDIRRLRALRADGWSQQKIGDELGVSQVQVSHILRGLQRKF